MRNIRHTDLLVSELCLGTIGFGEHISKEDAFKQLDMAVHKYGINFIVN